MTHSPDLHLLDDQELVQECELVQSNGRFEVSLRHGHRRRSHGSGGDCKATRCRKRWCVIHGAEVLEQLDRY